MNDDVAPATEPRAAAPVAPLLPSMAPPTASRAAAPAATEALAAAASEAAAPMARQASSNAWRWMVAACAVLALVAILALIIALRAEQRVRSSERELVQRQQESGERAAEAHLLARQAEDATRAALAKVALLEARLDDVAVQRGQLEELIQSVARSRDEALLADIEGGLRAAVQQANLTGSAEPLVAALRQSDERLARADQARLEPIRRAIAHDLERVKLAGVADVATLTIRLDEASRLVDELPLLSAAEPRRELARGAAPGTTAAAAPASAASATGFGGWASGQLDRAGRFVVDRVWSEVRSLVRVTRIDHPEAMLVTPEQGYFLRENLKLRLLNARLALLARQGDSAQADLVAARASVERYFDRGARRTQSMLELLRQVGQQSVQAAAPRPDDTFAALATLSPRR